jgi:hypothetical protein
MDAPPQLNLATREEKGCLRQTGVDPASKGQVWGTEEFGDRVLVRIPINSDTHSKNIRTVFREYSDSCRSEATLCVTFKRVSELGQDFPLSIPVFRSVATRTFSGPILV